MSYFFGIVRAQQNLSDSCGEETTAGDKKTQVFSMKAHNQAAPTLRVHVGRICLLCRRYKTYVASVSKVGGQLRKVSTLRMTFWQFRPRLVLAA